MRIRRRRYVFGDGGRRLFCKNFPIEIEMGTFSLNDDGSETWRRSEMNFSEENALLITDLK